MYKIIIIIVNAKFWLHRWKGEENDRKLLGSDNDLLDDELSRIHNTKKDFLRC
jgi:hypothetical protein